MTPAEAREILPGAERMQEEIEKLGGKISEQGARDLVAWLANDWVSDMIEDEDEDEEDEFDDEDDDDLDDDELDDEDEEKPDA